MKVKALTFITLLSIELKRVQLLLVSDKKR